MNQWVMLWRNNWENIICINEWFHAFDASIFWVTFIYASSKCSNQLGLSRGHRILPFIKAVAIQSIKSAAKVRIQCLHKCILIENVSIFYILFCLNLIKHLHKTWRTYTLWKGKCSYNKHICRCEDLPNLPVCIYLHVSRIRETHAHTKFLLVRELIYTSCNPFYDYSKTLKKTS